MERAAVLRPPRGHVASALAASGERVFSRSYKYHRPRGLLTADFLDPGCHVQVGDEPNVRGAHRLVEAGMDVRSQNTWPSLRFDLKAVNGLAGRFLGTGFYYKTFIKPERLWPVYERVLRRFVHAGTVSPDAPHEYYDKRYAHAEVLVAGGGPAGMAAAVAAARAGARALLVEEEHQLGGHLRWGDHAERAVRADLEGQVCAEPGIEVMTDSVVVGRWDDKLGRRDAAQLAARRGAPGRGQGRVARGGSRPDRTAVCLRGQRPAGGDALDGRTAVDQPLRRAARPARCRVLGQPGG
jgi:sarcosine oxidase, subunit alpha